MLQQQGVEKAALKGDLSLASGVAATVRLLCESLTPLPATAMNQRYPLLDLWRGRGYSQFV
jgi:hypothetical protein